MTLTSTSSAPAAPAVDTPTTARAGRPASRWRGPRTRFVALDVAGFTTFTYVVLSLVRFADLRAGIDLAIFTQAASRYAHGQRPWSDMKGAWGFDLLGDHFSPVIALLGPVYRLFPHAESLLVVQAVLVGLTAGIVTRAGTRLLGLRAGATAGVLYGAAWGTRAMALFDFHEVAFALPLVAASCAALLRGRDGVAVLWSLPLMGVKEDSVFLLAGLVLVLLWRRRWGLAAALAAYAVGSFALIVDVLVPHFSYYGAYTYWSSSAASGGNLLSSALTNLGHAMSSGFAPRMLLVLLLPTLGVALRSPLLLAVLPSLAARLTAPEASYWGLRFHYNATITVIIAFAFLDGLSRCSPDARRRLLAWALVVTVALLPLGPSARVVKDASTATVSCRDLCAPAKVPELLGKMSVNAPVAASDTLVAYLSDQHPTHGIHDGLTPTDGLRDSTGRLLWPMYFVIDRRAATPFQLAWLDRAAWDGENYQIAGQARNEWDPRQFDVVVVRVLYP